VDIDDEQFYAMLEASDELPTTSQITVFQYGEVFEAAYKEGFTDVINTTINAEASGTYNSACLAARMFYESHPEAEKTFRIHNIDGVTYTAAYGYAVVCGAKMAQEGKNADEIVAFMKDFVEHYVIYFVPYTLEYASKSGRIPSAAAFVGELVGLKPIMRIADHKIATNDKIRGEKKIIPTLVKKALSEMVPGSEYMVVCGNTIEDRDSLEAAMTEAVGYAPSARYRIGAAITINAGPRTVGVAIRTK
jgi:DegV family protein with EDD domain